MTKCWLFQWCKTNSIFTINEIYHIDNLKKKNHTVISIYAEKTFEKLIPIHEKFSEKQEWLGRGVKSTYK